MALACQRNSYLRRLKSKVISCEEAEVDITNNGKPNKTKGFNIILEDTVLFPEGGGQPDDRGTINGVPVLRVTRRGNQAVHFLTKKFELQDDVDLEVDWDRRLDHMQQHSGQHLITAIADLEFGYPTTSWYLGETVSYIELDVASIKPETIKKLESIVNEKIRARTPVTVKSYEEGAEELKQARTRGLPDDYKGPVRVVTIEGLENNMCCGTHVSNLADLQVIKILHTEKGKKSKTNLFFIAGNRVIQYLDRCIEREKKFTSILKGGPEDHVDLLNKMQNSFKLSQKNELSLLKEMAAVEAIKIKSIQPKPKFHSLHKKEANATFMSIIANDVNDEDILLFLSIGEEKGPGQILITGKPELVAQVGSKAVEILDGKGAANGNKFQGKVNNMSHRIKVEQFIKDIVGGGGGDVNGSDT